MDEGIDYFIYHFDKKITTAGKDPVTTVPAVISSHLLIVRKNFNSFSSVYNLAAKKQ
jgi:hypothetical protein